MHVEVMRPFQRRRNAQKDPFHQNRRNEINTPMRSPPLLIGPPPKGNEVGRC